MSYQDHWVKGRVVRRGIRECSDRYAVIRSVCEPIAERQDTLTVCDIGANACYFGLRLTEEFENCRVVAYEFSNTRIAETLIRRNKQSRVMLYTQKLSLGQVKLLSHVSNFDVVLAMSVLHHVKPFDSWVSALSRLGKNVIAELALDDSRSRVDHESKMTGTVIGYGKSHIKRDYLRPIVLIQGQQ